MNSVTDLFYLQAHLFYATPLSTEACVLLRCYTVHVGNCLPEVLVLSVRVKQFFLHYLTLKGGISKLSQNIGKKTTNIHCVTSQKSEGVSYTAAQV